VSQFPLRPLASFILALSAASIAGAVEVKSVPAREAAQLVADGKAVLVDVREAPEWKNSGVAAPAALLSKSDFDGDQKLWKPFLAQNRDKQILVYCASGGRSREIAAALAEKGLNAGNVGRLRDWTNAGLPVRKVE
jgi:rhodanese-related sulfurtransferase